MNFIDLQAVIQHLKEFVPCPSCKAKFELDKIMVVATFGNEGFITTSCKKCGMHALMNFVLTRISAASLKKAIEIRTKATSKVSLNEVLDLHNFLKTFKGDLKELFQ